MRELLLWFGTISIKMKLNNSFVGINIRKLQALAPWRGTVNKLFNLITAHQLYCFSLVLFLKSLHLAFNFLFLFFAMQVMQFIYSIILRTCVYFHRQPFVHTRPKFHSFKLSFVPVWKHSGAKNLIFECNVCMSNLCTNLCINWTYAL